MYTTEVFSQQKSYRLIPSHFPPLDIFEDVACDEEFSALFAIQALTNPRIQNDIGNLALIEPEQRIYGVQGAGYIMACFTHLNPDGSRFSNGDFGVFYASKSLLTAVEETKYHRERFYRYTNEPAQSFDMRSLTAYFNAELLDLYSDTSHDNPIYHPENYNAGQLIGAQIKRENKDGIVYRSVRHNKGLNYALFKPKLIHACKQSMHLTYVWDGSKIASIYKKSVFSPA